MRFITTWLVVLFLAVASSEPASPEKNSTTKVEEITEASVIRSHADDSKTETTQSEKSKKNDENYLITTEEMTPEELFVIEKIVGDQEKTLQELNQKTKFSDNIENSRKADDVSDNPENPIESKINKDVIDIRRQDTNPKSKQENSSPEIQFDDSKTEVTSDPPQRYGQRSRNFRQKFQDSAPLLQLTQGGYERPYRRPRYRNRYSPRPDSSEQSENVQKPERTSNNKMQDTRGIVPQVTYANTAQPSYVLGQGPFISPPFDASAGDMLAINQIVPPSAHNRFLNSPPPEFTGYSAAAFHPHFTSNSDVGSIPNFTRDPSNTGVYQTLSSNPFQTPRILFQNSPQIQPQPVMMDSAGNVQSQFQQNPFSPYSGYENTGTSSTPNYESLFRNSGVNTPFQVPPNFYGNAPNAANPFSSPPISFLSQYPNFGNGMPSQFLQYPDVTTRAQNNMQSSNNPQFVSETSQDENNAKVVLQNAHNPVNRDDSAPAQFGTGLQAGNIANVYMRYPTIEAGYAIEEIMPALNKSDQSKNESKPSNGEQTNNPHTDLNRNALNSIRSNQKINNSFDFPPEFLRSAPIDFVYQRPQGGIFTQQIDRNRGLPNYPSRNFESRIPFNAIASPPESFFVVDNDQHVHPEANETPSCAKGNNVSVCFEDNDYPKNDILYTLNSNSFLTDRLANPGASFDFVERNSNETEQNEENYACDVATKYGTPLRAKNIAGKWKIVVNLQGRFSQPVRMEVCKALGSSCSYSESLKKTTCVQKFSLQRLLTWSPSRGIYLDVYKIPVACSCQIIETVEV